MKKLIYTIISSIILLTSCEKEDCICPEPVTIIETDTLYIVIEDTTQILDTRLQYIGNYIVTDSVFYLSENGTAETYFETTPYIINISTQQTISDTLYFSNLYNYGIPYFSLLGGTYFSFPLQTINFEETFLGTGSFSTDIFEFETTVLEDNDPNIRHKVRGIKQ